MDNLSKKTYAASKKYTDDSLDGVGALKGAPCTIKSKTPIQGGTRIIFEWTGNSGSTYETTLDVMDGKDGASGEGVVFAYIVGDTPFSSDWLSDTEGSEPIDPDGENLYLILTAGNYKNQFYHWTGDAYELVGSTSIQSITSAELAAMWGD